MQLPQGCTIKTIAESELEAIWLSNAHCEALISLHGAQVLKFYAKAKQQELLWLSEQAQYQSGKAIRGGIPLCFPWFGAHPTDHQLPAHGFARQQLWQLTAISLDDAGHHLIFELQDSAASRQLWNYAFKLQMHIHCGASLELELHVQNLDQQPFSFSFAWHSYFALPAQQVKVRGLAALTYIDQLDGHQHKQQETELLNFTAELDRIYPKTSGEFVLTSEAEPEIEIKSSACSAVIWNPWIEKTKRLNDVAENAWQDFICVETGQIASETQSLAAGEQLQYRLKIT